MKRRSRCFTNYAPVLCVRSVIRLAISTQLRWIKRSWAGVQKVKGVAFTIRQSSLERLRYVPERLPLRGQDGHFMLVDYGYASCQIVRPKAYRSLCGKCGERSRRAHRRLDGL